MRGWSFRVPFSGGCFEGSQGEITDLILGHGGLSVCRVEGKRLAPARTGSFGQKVVNIRRVHDLSAGWWFAWGSQPDSCPKPLLIAETKQVISGEETQRFVSYKGSFRKTMTHNFALPEVGVPKSKAHSLSHEETIEGTKGAACKVTIAFPNNPKFPLPGVCRERLLQHHRPAGRMATWQFPAIPLDC